MQLYKTTGVDSVGEVATSWQASQTEASKARAKLKKDGFKPETQTVQVPTAKGALIDWLNENCCA